MKRLLFRQQILYTLIALTCFVTPSATFAQTQVRDIVVPAGNRLCLLNISVWGITDRLQQRLQGKDAETQANILIAAGADPDNITGDFCGLHLRGTNNVNLKNGSTIVPIGQKINIATLFSSAMTGSRASAERAEKPAVFFERGLIRQLNADDSVTNCNPIDLDTYEQWLEKGGDTAVDLNRVYISDEPVTEQSCPIVKANFYKNVGNNKSYLLRMEISDGSGPNETATVDPRLLAETKFDSAILKDMASSLNLVTAKSIPELIGAGLKIAMGIIGSIALLVLIAAGIIWMTAAGNAEREKRAMSMIMWGGMGILVILSSYAIVQFIFENAF